MKPTRFFLPVLFALVLPCLNYSQAAENNIQFRGNIDNSRIQFLKNKKGNVAFMGGSITEMNGYRPMVADQLKKRFPETNFTLLMRVFPRLVPTQALFASNAMS
jgi:hypothetical protein